MNKVTIYRYDENKPMRTLNLNGEPWFVLRDVCEVLGLGNSRMVADRLDEDEKGVSQIDTLGGVQNATIISESGLYNVILRSDKPEAKPFRKWVTAVVLPSIRKNGGYIAGQEELSPQELMAKALLVAQKTLTDRDARIKELTAQNQIMQPKAEYFDELVARNLLTNFRETAKELGIKEKDFIGWLLDHKYVYRDQKNKLMPYAAKKQRPVRGKRGKGPAQRLGRNPDAHHPEGPGNLPPAVQGTACFTAVHRIVNRHQGDCKPKKNRFSTAITEMVGKRKARNWLFLEYIHLFLDKYSKMAENRPKSAGTSAGQSGGASDYNRTLPNQTVTCCQIFTSFKFANGAGAGPSIRQGLFATAANKAIQRLSTL